MQRRFIFFLMIFLISCLGQAMSDLYLPALPAIGRSFSTSTHHLQFSIALYFFGYALSHLVYGPLSDSIGRRTPLLLGTAIAFFGTLLCLFSPGISLFNIGRVVQGLGAGASAALFQSILRDVYSGRMLAKVSSFLAIARIFLLAGSPLIGALCLGLWGWRACFVFLGIYAALCWIGTALFLPETNQHKDLNTLTWKTMRNNAQTLLKSRVFMGYTLCVMLVFGGILSWLSTLPIFLQQTLSLTPMDFGYLAVSAGFLFAIGGFSNAMLLNVISMRYLLQIGILLMSIGALLMLCLSLAGYMSTWVVISPVLIFIFGASFIFPNAYACAFEPFPTIAGAAGALFGFFQMLGGALGALGMSYASLNNQLPLGIALFIITVLTYGSLRLALSTPKAISH